MDKGLFPKLLLWGMLLLSCLGAVGTLLRSETDPMPLLMQQAAEQQMAVETAVGFAREWMRWDGEELPEARLQRLKPYVNPDALARIAALQTEQKSSRQQVLASELISYASRGSQLHAVRVRVVTTNPERAVWEVEVPVWTQASRGAVISPPLIRPVQAPPVVSETGAAGAAASAETKQRMRPAIESFLKAMCEGKDAESLFNYVTAEAKLTPLAGRIRFASLEHLEAVGSGPYTVTVSFAAQDAATGFRLTQEWKLAVTEENGKFFVSGISV
jgi:hypothetical protein